MSYKFILDTNVLDNESVNKLRKAGLIEACHTGRVAFYFTPVLLKERLDFLLKGSILKTTEEPIQLLLSLRWQRFFNDLNGSEGILTSELEGKLPSECLFINSSQIKENLAIVLQGGELSEGAKEEVQRDKDRWASQKQQNCIAYREMREQINDYRRKNPSSTRKGSKFLDFRNANFEKTAIDKIQKSINSNIPKDKLIEYWKLHQDRCLYFNKFVEGELFKPWYFMASEQEPKIDPNAYEDIEHLLYLNGADGIVSNEKRFIREACRELFPDKDFLTVDQFVDKLSYHSVVV